MNFRVRIVQFVSVILTEAAELEPALVPGCTSKERETEQARSRPGQIFGVW